MGIPIVMVCAVLLGSAALSSAQALKVGFVDTDRLLNGSVQGRRATETLKREFAQREKEILELQKRIAADRARFDKERSNLPPDELRTRGTAIGSMMTKSDQMAVALAEDHERRRSELRAKIIEEAKAAINAVAQAGKFDLIVEQAIYRSPALDVTDQVLKEMARRAGAAK